MKKAFAISGALLGLFFTMMLFVMLLRIANEKDAFISIRVLWDYIASIDLSRAWNELYTKFMEVVASFKNIGAVSETANEWQKFFEVVSNFGVSIYNVLKFPLDIFLSICNFIYDLLDMVRRFFIVVLQ